MELCVILLAIASVPVAFAVLTRALHRWWPTLTIPFVVLAGCGGGSIPDGSGGTAGATTTKTTAPGDPCDDAGGVYDKGGACCHECLGPGFLCGGCECPTPCVAPQVCAIGCGTTWGCYTPGGNPTNPGPNDCPSCFRDPADDAAACDSGTYPHAQWCQKGAKPIDGCVMAAASCGAGMPNCAFVMCCPLPPDGGP